MYYALFKSKLYWLLLFLKLDWLLHIKKNKTLNLQQKHRTFVFGKFHLIQRSLGFEWMKLSIVVEFPFNLTLRIYLKLLRWCSPFSPAWITGESRSKITHRRITRRAYPVDYTRRFHKTVWSTIGLRDMLLKPEFPYDLFGNF